jgi:hypothetical protein
LLGVDLIVRFLRWQWRGVWFVRFVIFEDEECVVGKSSGCLGCWYVLVDSHDLESKLTIHWPCESLSLGNSQDQSEASARGPSNCYSLPVSLFRL